MQVTERARARARARRRAVLELAHSRQILARLTLLVRGNTLNLAAGANTRPRDAADRSRARAPHAHPVVESLDFDFLSHIIAYIPSVCQNRCARRHARARAPDCGARMTLRQRARRRSDLFDMLLRLLEALAVHTMTVKHLKIYMRLFQVAARARTHSVGSDAAATTTTSTTTTTNKQQQKIHLVNLARVCAL